MAVVANSNGSLGTVGISGNEAMGRILAGGVRDMADWVNKLYGQAFAAVYVQPGAKVAVHLEQPLDIDYDAKGRRVHHRTEKPMPRIWIDAPPCCWRPPCLGGCATSSEKLLPRRQHHARHLASGDRRQRGRRPGRAATARCAPGLRRPLTEADAGGASACRRATPRTAQNEIHRQFHRLPNPDLVMYVFPHLAGTDPVPVPGYSTVFPLYQRVQYAMPGERVEDY